MSSTPCIEWPHARTEAGYGVTWFQGKWFLAHRRAWIEANGSIPDGLKVLHNCDNPPCTNVEHLYLGTTSDNARDSVDRGRARTTRQNGVLNHSSKFSEDEVRTMRSSYPRLTYQEIADQFGCSLSVAWNIVKGNTYKEVVQ